MNIGKGFQIIGLFLLKLFGSLPVYDPENRGYFVNDFVRNYTDMVSTELKARFNFMNMFVSIPSDQYLEKYDQSYTILKIVNETLNSLNKNRKFYQRSSKNYTDFKSSYEENIKNLLNVINNNETHPNIWKMSQSLRINISNKYPEYIDLIEPTYFALIMIEISQSLKQSIHHHIFSIGIFEINVNDDYSSIFGYIFEINNIIIKYHRKQYNSKNIALEDFYDVFKRAKMFIKGVFIKIDLINSLNIHNFKIIQPEISNEYFDKNIKETTNIDIKNENKSSLLRIITNFSYYILEKLDYLLNVNSSDIYITELIYMNKFYVGILSDESSDIEQIINLSILKSKYEKMNGKNIYRTLNIYEYGYPALSLEISATVGLVKENLCHSNIKSYILEEIFSVITQIQSLDISSSLVIFLNRLDQLYQSMESLKITQPIDINDSVNLIKSIILKIRKIQFDCWPFILDDYDIKCMKEFSYIYFEIFDHIEAFLNSPNNNFFYTLQNFIENQSLSSYKYSVNTIKSLLQMINHKYFSSKDVFSNLVNFISYFEQYFDPLKNFHESHTQEILKNLQEFTNISRWRDFNYWSIKESSSKAHKTLHKYISKYQVFVNQPIVNVIKILPFEMLNISKLRIEFYKNKKAINFKDKSLTLTIKEISSLNYNNIQFYNSISKDLTKIYKKILENQHRKFLYIKNSVINYFDTPKSDNILTNSDLTANLQKMGLLDRPRSSISLEDTFSDQNIYRGPINFLVSELFKDINDQNNAVYMRGLNKIQTISNKISQIKKSKNEISQIYNSLYNILNLVSRQRNIILEFSNIFNNMKKIDKIFLELTNPKSQLINLPENNVQNIFIKLSKITEKIDEFRILLSLNTKVDRSYSSPYFPNEKINHSNINDIEIKDFRAKSLEKISESVIYINKILNKRKNLKFIKVSSLNRIIDIIMESIGNFNKIKISFEKYSLFDENTFIECINYIIEIFSKVVDEINLFKLSAIKSVEEEDIKINEFIEYLLVPLQNLKLNKLINLNIIYNTGEMFIELFSKVSEDYIYNLCPSLAKLYKTPRGKMIYDLFTIDMCLIENSMQFYVRINSVYTFMLYLLSEAYFKSLNSIEKKEKSENINDEASKKTDILQETEMAGFQDGKGHENISDKIPDQDVFEDAKQKDEIFDSSVENLSEKYSNFSNEESDNEIEDSDIDTNFQEYCSKIKDDNEDLEDIEDMASSVSQSVCNDTKPDEWKSESDDKDHLENVKTEKNILDGEQELTNSDCVDDQSINLSDKNDEISNKENVSSDESFKLSLGLDSIMDFSNDDSQLKNGNMDSDSQSSISKNTNENILRKRESKSENIGTNKTENHSNEGNISENDFNSLECKENLGNNKRKFEEIDKNKNIKIKKLNENVNLSQNNIDKNDENKSAIPNEANADSVVYASNKYKLIIMDDKNIALKELKSMSSQYNQDVDRDQKIEESDNFNELEMKNEQKEKLEDSKSEFKEAKYNENRIISNEDIDYYESFKVSLNLAIILCENLRIILEPTRRTKFQGNYKTGRKINMRKIVSYIASNYTRDKIWLRRTKPSSREYKVIIAVDDSYSMRDNETRKSALISLLTISNAFRLLEIGKVSIVSFGENVKTLLDFDDILSEERTRIIWDSLDFYQMSTKIASLLEFCDNKFKTTKSLNSNEFEKLVIIISDGRGIFSHGEASIKKAIYHLNEQNVLTIFIIMDNINPNLSILKINVPEFKDTSHVPTIKSYMELFPFQYYIILKDVKELPECLSNITRQWIQFTN